MAQHKAATDVTIAPLSEKSFIEELVSRYWMPAVGIGLLIAGISVYRVYAEEKGQELAAAAWDELFDKEGTPEEFALFASQRADDPAAPWAKLMAVSALVGEKRYDEAATAIDELRKSFPNHPLVTDKLDFGDGRPQRSLLEDLQGKVDAQRAWEKDNPGLFENPPPPEGSPRVKLVTDAGDIVVALYENEAPTHVANFLKLCKDGYYDGTRFHRVMPNFMIQGGDPNSRDDDRSTWGQGGPDEKIAPEPNDLYHFEGVLSAAKAPGDTDSSGSQFFLTVGTPHHLDGQHVVFGAVVEGMDTVFSISEGEMAEGAYDQPAEPVTITATEIL